MLGCLTFPTPLIELELKTVKHRNLMLEKNIVLVMSPSKKIEKRMAEGILC